MKTQLLFGLLCWSFTSLPDALATDTLSCTCTNVCRCTGGTDDSAAAVGSFSDSVESKGWGELRVQSSDRFSDTVQAYSAGYVEGMLTQPRIAQHHRTFMEATFTNDTQGRALLQTATDFVMANDEYMRAQAAAASPSDQWWRQASLIWSQLEGILAGYNAAASKSGTPKLSRRDLLLVNAVVDLSSIIHKPFLGDKRLWPASEARDYTERTTHCSALVKLLPDFSELFTSHNTWTAFYMMLRVAKSYDFPFSGAKARTMLFSGYFGTLASTDDFFVLSSGLLVQETTNAVYNASLLQQIVPQAVLTWARSLVANRLAMDGQTWTDAFRKHNSGTINNQWMVVDYNRFTPGKPLPPGTFWVLEQLPTYIEAADMTSTLSLGYWPSYNRAWFPRVAALSGQDEMAAAHGDYYSHSLYARAKIFRRDHNKVVDRASMKTIMRYNQYQTDPFSRQGGGSTAPDNPDACLTIACRGDLEVPPRDLGNTDAKLVGREDVLNMRMEAVSGPTSDDQPPFDWTKASTAPLAAHYGQPHFFDFAWFNFSAS